MRKKNKKKKFQIVCARAHLSITTIFFIYINRHLKYLQIIIIVTRVISRTQLLKREKQQEKNYFLQIQKWNIYLIICNNNLFVYIEGVSIRETITLKLYMRIIEIVLLFPIEKYHKNFCKAFHILHL